MKKIKGLLGIFILNIVFAYIVIFSGFHFVPRGNIIDQNLRISILKIKPLQYLFFLNDWGDARFEYLSDKNDTIYVEVDYYGYYMPTTDIEYVMRDTVYELTGKNVEVNIVRDKKVPESPLFSDRLINKILPETRNYKGVEGQDWLHIVYLTKYQGDEALLAKTYGKNEILIFKETMENVTDKWDVLSRIEDAVLKREFARLLGANNLDREECIMNTSLEEFSKKTKLEDVPEKYCPETLVAIEDFQNMIEGN